MSALAPFWFQIKISDYNYQLLSIQLQSKRVLLFLESFYGTTNRNSLKYYGGG